MVREAVGVIIVRRTVEDDCPYKYAYAVRLKMMVRLILTIP